MSPSSISSSRRGLRVLLLAIGLGLALDRLVFDVFFPFARLEERLGPPHFAERGVARDQVVLRRLRDADPSRPRIVALGSSRGEAGFRPELPGAGTPPSWNVGVLAHAGMMPFEMRSHLDTVRRRAPQVALLLLSEFELHHPLQPVPWVATGSPGASFALAAAAGPGWLREHRHLFLRLGLTGLLRAYRFRVPLRRAGLEDALRFELGPRFAASRRRVELYDPAPDAVADAAGRALLARAGSHLTPKGIAIARLQLPQVRSLAAGAHVDVQRTMLRQLVSGLRRSGSEVLLVELPVFPGADSLYDPTLRDAFHAFAASLVRDEQVFFVPLEDMPRFDEDAFDDLTHLSEVGAARLTRHVVGVAGRVLAGVSPPSG